MGSPSATSGLGPRPSHAEDAQKRSITKCHTNQIRLSISCSLIELLGQERRQLLHLLHFCSVCLWHPSAPPMSPGACTCNAAGYLCNVTDFKDVMVMFGATAIPAAPLPLVFWVASVELIGKLPFPWR
jgi:hypothetical protein